jgi:hypothetical protein
MKIMFWTYPQNMKMRYVERCFLLVNLAALPKDGVGLALEREGQGGIPGPPSPTYLPLPFLPPSSSLSLGLEGGGRGGQGVLATCHGGREGPAA